MNSSIFVQHYQSQKSDLMDFAIYLTQDEALAEDLLQETLYKAYKHKKLYQPGTNWKAWLTTIMRNTFINDYRKQKRRMQLAPEADRAHWVSSKEGAQGNDGETSVSLKEIFKEIKQLDDWMRVPFMMHYQGFKYEEIATQLDLPLGTVKSRIFFARKKLRAKISSMYPGDVRTALSA